MKSERRSHRGCLWAVIALCCVVVIAGAGLLLASLALSRAFHLPRHHRADHRGVDEYPDLEEVWSSGSGDAKVVLIPIRGFIQLEQEADWLGGSASSSQTALMAIRRATHDSAVRAIILDVDSGGGGITASDILYKALMDFRNADEGRIVVAMFGDVAASGAYYIAVAADHIIAHPTTITGSIGVLMQSLNLRGLGEKLGVHDVTIKSGRNKDLLNPLQELSPEQRAMLQTIVDDLHTRFVTLVAERRKLPVGEVRAIADGRILTAAGALSSGLIDQIGYREDATIAVSELLGVDDVRIFRYEERFSFSSFLRSVGAWGSPRAALEDILRTQFLYRWPW